MGIVTFAVVRVFDEPGDINTFTVAALTAVLAMPAAFIKFYQWVRPGQGK